jgi:hypothetical protein
MFPAFRLSHYRAHDQQQHDDEQHRADDARRDQMQRIELRRIALEIGPAAHAEKRPEHRFHELEKAALPARCVHLQFAACFGASSSKNVYDKVIVFTSFGSFGSTTNTTGMRFVSFGASVCCVKQKHSILLKYSVACFGA